MIFITGGAWQGKTAFAETLAVDFVTMESGERVSCAGSITEKKAVPVACGRSDPFETAFERPVISGFHYFVRRLLPADPEERAWREAAGRAAEILAADSDAVYRMICGIAVRLK